ncbi:MAG: flagellar hook-associated protein FlgK [Pseudomonadota bacterium]
MSSILNIGVLALNANQAALQTVSNNIANVNTPGYSRQQVVLQNIQGQYTGSGYFGKGVDVLTVTRSYNDFLNRQAASAQAVSTADTTRLNKLNQLETYFKVGSNGLGATISDFMNAFSDIVSAPTDLTARSVALTRADEMASRFNQMYLQLDQMRIGNTEELKTAATAINDLARQIAKANQDISRSLGNGQQPNDLLDQRDQLIRNLNKYIQTTTIPADDGTLGIFIGGSQALVLGTTVSPVSIQLDKYSDLSKAKLAVAVAGAPPMLLDENTLGGGEVSGMLRFQNQDLLEARNLLGRLALAIGTKLNEQQALGIDLNGNAGSPLFSLPALPDGLAHVNNTGTAALSLVIQTTPTSGVSAFVATDYDVVFATGTTGTITRQSDGTQVAFDTAVTNPVLIDGLELTISAGAAAGDRYVLKPFSNAASSISTAFASPRGLAMASPITAIAGANNAGTVTLEGLRVDAVPTTLPAPAVTLRFIGTGQYIRSDDANYAGLVATLDGPPPLDPASPAYAAAIAAHPAGERYTYVPGQVIGADDRTTNLPFDPATEWSWSLTLKGVPQPGDTYAVDVNPYPQLNADNAQAMLDLRDLAMFDGGPLTDGYASAIAVIGTRILSAQSAAAVSADIASNLEKERTSIQGVNLDEEAARLIQFQQAYQASGKMMQVAQTIFDTLLASIGR